MQWIRDDLVAGLLLIAAAAGAAERALLVGLAGAGTVFAIGWVTNHAGGVLGGRAGTLGRVVVAIACGGAFTWLLWHASPLVPFRGLTDPRAWLGGVIAAAVFCTIYVLQRAWAAGESEPLGWADVAVGSAIGTWFGLRWMRTPLAVGIAVAMVVGLVQWSLARAGRWTGARRGLAASQRSRRSCSDPRSGSGWGSGH